MAFPNSLECKIAKVERTPAYTTILVRIYKVSDGGFNMDGRQLYNRILVREFERTIDAGIPKADVVRYLKKRLQDINDELALGYTADTFICSM